MLSESDRNVVRDIVLDVMREVLLEMREANLKPVGAIERLFRIEPQTAELRRQAKLTVSPAVARFIQDHARAGHILSVSASHVLAINPANEFRVVDQLGCEDTLTAISAINQLE